MLKACLMLSLLSSENYWPHWYVVFEVAIRVEFLLSAPPQGRSSVNDSITPLSRTPFQDALFHFR